MISIARYAWSDYARSQRFLPPLVAYLGTLAILYAFPPGPILPAYGLTAALILPVCAWLTVNLHNSEDPVQAGVTVVNAGGFGRVMIGKTTVAVGWLLALTVTSLIWPMVSHGQFYAPGDLAEGLVAHLTCGLTGIAIGTCCIRSIIRRQGYAFAIAFLLSLVGLFDRALAPANETIRLLSAAPPRPSAVVLLLLAVWIAAHTTKASAERVAQAAAAKSKSEK